MVRDLNTQEKVMHFGKQEFLVSGFKNASLRNIAAAAGMTTGAIYSHFKDKNALFEAIVNPVCQKTEEMFNELSREYYNAGQIGFDINTQKSLCVLSRVYEFIYENFDEFRMLVCGAEGSSKEEFVHTLVTHEVNYTYAYLESMREAKGIPIPIEKNTIHIISDGYIAAILEPVRHNMSFEDALKNVEFLGRFYTGGWEAVIKSFSENS